MMQPLEGEALKIYTEIGDRQGEADALQSMDDNLHPLFKRLRVRLRGGWENYVLIHFNFSFQL